ncbi:MAG: hypothetical protein GY750_15345, partial [Lentisphaerae bacterium]|nr:hypothetical protein [Lentisphaerota bacterium]
GRAEADDYFNYGKLTWTSGNNDGRSMEVKSSGSGTFILFQPMPSVVQIGDTYSVYKGCDRKKASCKGFGNYDNYQGFPDLPGIDAMMNYPDAKN